MKERFDYFSRFKILKGGRISLIVSALVTSVTLSFASPSGGVVTSGNANISQSGIVTNINQSSQKVSINWNTFSINKNEIVNFNQPNVNSITLNRVIGNERSIINGALNANGQVWILNSNGVLFGKNASVNTSGLLATTASLSDEAFQAGAYHFKNATSNTIINEGTIKVNNSSYVILASNETRNTGSIEAVKAKVHLVGANEYSINLNGNSLVDLTIEKGVMDALVENSGTIINEAGEIYLTTNAVNELLKGVVNHTGIIEANSLDELTGKVELFAHGGEVQVGGTIEAKDGFVETSGKDFKILDNATIEAGKWLIDPVDITIDDTLASTIETALTSGDVTIETTSSSSSVDTSSNETSSDGDTTDGDIYVNSNITWSTDKKLTLTADDEIYVNATIKNTNNSNGGVYFNAANTTDKVIFGTNGKVIINNVYQLQWINQALNGTYELGSNINAGATTTWNSDGSDGYYGWDPIGDSSTSFIGSFDGNDYTINSLYINRPNKDYVGLFGFMGNNGIVINIGLTNVNITGDEYVGGLAGYNFGKISNSYATGRVRGTTYVGGLVGRNNDGTIKNSYATGSVDGRYFVGGLVGANYNYGTIKNSYATGRVDGSSHIGGLVGVNYGEIIDSYATGRVAGSSSAYVGGLVGINYERIRDSYATGSVSGYYRVGGLVGNNDDGTITESYWDKQTSGQTNGVGFGDDTGVTGLTTEQFADSSYFSTWYSGFWQLGGGSSIEGYGLLLRPYLKGVTIDSDKDVTTLFASGYGTEASPYTITTWAQLANIDYNNKTRSYYYDLLNNLTTSTTGYSTYASASANGGKGWDPIGDNSSKFTGSFDGNSHVIDALHVNRPNKDYMGLFGYVNNGSNIRNVGLTNVDITGNIWVGGLVGYNDHGEITNSYAIGSVSGKKYVGGLVGYNDYGDITNSYATGSVRGTSAISAVGGLVGTNYKGTIKNSYATGSVSGNDYVGGLVGLHDGGTITNSYWDTETSGQTTSAGGTGLTSAQMGYGGAYDSFWNIEIDNTLTSGNAPVLRYNADGSATWIIAPLKLSYSLENQTLTYNGIQNLSSFYTSSSIFGSDYDFIDSSGYSFIDGSDSTITSVRNAGTYRVGLKSENSFLSMASTGNTKGTITINKKEITATYSAEDKTYDGTSTATVNGSLDGIISGDSVSLLNQSANFEDKNAGENKQVNITNIALSGNDASNYVVSDTTTSATINKKEITATYSANDKIYDGTTLANVNGSLNDAISGDSISLMQNANYIDKNAGTNKKINITNIALSGDDALNYTLTSPTTATTSANINKKGITATYSGKNKTYDGTTTATVNGSLVDAISGDSISLIQSASFEDKNAGDDKQVNITNIALSGNDALNYTLTSPTTATTNATINKKELTATYSAEDKTYDGTTTATVSGSLNGGIISGDSVSLLNQSANFEDKNAGENKQVNITNIALSGDDASNYVVNDTITSANINKKEITATYIAENKTYDGTTTAIVNGSLDGGIISGDSVSLLNQSANFEDKNAGSNKQVNITNITLSGDDALNYVVSDTTTNATINKKEITATYTAENKTYDGTTTAIVSGSLVDAINGDSISLIQSANFEDKNAGENKNVLVSSISLDGDDAKNYKLASTSYITNANITPKVVEVRYSAEDKTYDRTNIADIKGSIEGILKGDKVSFISGEGYFKDSIPGINKTVYIEGFRLEGKDSKNYVLDADSYTTIASINIDLEDIIASIRKEEEYKIKNYLILFNPIRKEIVLEIINGGIKLPKTVMTQFLFFNDSDNKGDEI